MKKLFLIFCLCCLPIVGVFAEDATHANALAKLWIITDWSSAPSRYRLSEPMLRQELIGIALQMNGTQLPDKFRCRGYFTDAAQNDWVCRAAELAADNGLVTRNNTTFRPMSFVTRAESLSILMQAAGIKITSSGIDWVTDIMDQARAMKIISAQESDGQSKITREEAFSMAHRILKSQDTTQKSGQYVRYVSPIAGYSVTYPANREIEENDDGSLSIATSYTKKGEEIPVAYIVGLIPISACEECAGQWFYPVIKEKLLGDDQQISIQKESNQKIDGIMANMIEYTQTDAETGERAQAYLGVLVSGGTGYLIGWFTDANTYPLVKKDIEDFILSTQFDVAPSTNTDAETTLNAADEYGVYDLEHNAASENYESPLGDYSVKDKNFSSEQFDDGSESTIGSESANGAMIFYSIVSGECTSCDSVEAEALKNWFLKSIEGTAGKVGIWKTSGLKSYISAVQRNSEYVSFRWVMTIVFYSGKYYILYSETDEQIWEGNAPKIAEFIRSFELN